MPYLIPDDYNPDDWTCIQLQWPNSPMFLGILRGIITQFMRGRIWDETTGSVKDAQQIGWEIFMRNWPFTDCDGGQVVEPPETPVIEAPGASGGYCCWWTDDDEECCIMPSGPCPPLKIENGILYWWNCCEWTQVGSLESYTQPVPNIPTEEPPAQYSACGEIDAVVDAIYVIAQAVWDNKDGLTYFANIGAVDSALPGFDVNNAGILSLLSGARVLDDTYQESEFLNSTLAQLLKCRMTSYVVGSATGFSAAEYDALKTVIGTVYPADSINWWRGIVESIGYNSLRVISASGAANSGADCSCPETVINPQPDPDSNGWYLRQVQNCFVSTPDGTPLAKWSGGGFSYVPSHDVFGIMYNIEVSGGNGTGWHPMGANEAINNVDVYDSCGDILAGYPSVNGNTSTVLALKLNRVVHGPGSVWDDILGAGTYNLLGNGQTWLGNPAAPELAKADQHNYYVRIDPWKNYANIQWKNIFLLHNTNSPSHS